MKKRTKLIIAIFISCAIVFIASYEISAKYFKTNAINTQKTRSQQIQDLLKRGEQTK